MAAYSYLQQHPNATKEEIENSMDGNLCRCTGYRPILDAIKNLVSTNERQQTKNDLSQETIKFLKAHSGHRKMLTQSGDGKEWFTPATLEQLLQLKDIYRDAKLVVGATEISIDIKFKEFEKKKTVFIHPVSVKELNALEVTSDSVIVGAAVSLTKFEEFIHKLIEELPEYQTSSLKAFKDQLRWFASYQIRNTASVGGNIATSSPISDLLPVFKATGSYIKVASKTNGIRTIKIDRNFFLGYRKTLIADDEVILNITIPLTRKNEFVRAFKQARRRDDDIAIVSCAFRVLLDEENLHGKSVLKVKEAILSYGGMGHHTKEAQKSSSLMVGKVWDEKLLEETLHCIEKELRLPLDAPGGMVDYRLALSKSFFYKYFMYVSKQFNLSFVPKEIENVIDVIPQRPLSSGKQFFKDSVSEGNVVGKETVHMSAYKQVTGEAKYIDDLPMAKNGLHGYFVLSTKAHAKVISIDPSKALNMEGVIQFFSAKDIPGKLSHGDELFAKEYVYGVGYPIGLVVATTRRQAELAAAAVKVEYGEDLPAVFTIQQAIEANSFYNQKPYELEKGEKVDDVFPRCDHVITGEVEIGGQEHFYLEPQVSYAEPLGEDNEITVHASTQNPSETQQFVAEILKVPYNRVTIKTKRAGGGFGGKETRSIFVSMGAALAASTLNVPVRIVLDRDEDMKITGGRHPFYSKYKVGFDKSGKLIAADIQIYSNGGWSDDLSMPVMTRAILNAENAYNIPHMRVRGHICKTNTVTNTAFRGFGGPQGLITSETYMDHIATYLNQDPTEIRLKNMYKPNDVTHYQYVLNDNDCTASKCFKEVLSVGKYEEKVKEMNEFNSKSKFLKRGIAVIPTKFGLSFTAKFMNQASALVHIYKDGSVSVSIGGMEMGQGLYTKMAQIAAEALRCNINSVYIAETATDKIINASATAASVQTDINGYAVLDACNQLNERLKPLREKYPDLDLRGLAEKAWFELIDLSAKGFYKRPHIGFDFESKKGQFQYYTNGAALSYVELDTLTGDFQTLESEIVMDIGKSISPSIDIGQIEGAFVQGVGYTTMEEVVYSKKNGAILTTGPGTYKIPSFKDIPIKMNVHLLRDTPCNVNIHSSKGIGEPPLTLGSSVYFALKNAIMNARSERGISRWFNLTSPATCERLRMSCPDNFTNH
eukprot:TRINITY_DN877_c0_g1_i1.p1 TRINITY_DN877_c0_g1~~TRINITY_DN877_c0_g1_i1.p1  ORF type:complete len:1295 (-),score=236.67 TRINITY_DN877_c0_g1_i1:47-3532(-)